MSLRNLLLLLCFFLPTLIGVGAGIIVSGTKETGKTILVTRPLVITPEPEPQPPPPPAPEQDDTSGYDDLLCAPEKEGGRKIHAYDDPLSASCAGINGAWRMKEALAVVKRTPRKFATDGTITPLENDAIPLSNPNPTVKITNATFTPRPDAEQTNSGYVDGSFHVTGTLGSYVCDVTPGANGSIDQVSVYLNTGDTPILVPVQVNKGQGQGPRKYPYSGTFTADIPAQLKPGPNTLIVSARDKVVGKVGSAEMVINVRGNGVADPTPGSPARGGFTRLDQPFYAEIDLTGVDLAAVYSRTASMAMSVTSLIDPSHPVITDTLTKYGLLGSMLRGETLGLTVDQAVLQAAKDGGQDVFTAVVDCPSITWLAREKVFRRVSGGRFVTDYFNFSVTATGGFTGAVPVTVSIQRGSSGPTQTATMSKIGDTWRSADGKLSMSVTESVDAEGIQGVSAMVESTDLGISCSVQAANDVVGGKVFTSAAVVEPNIDEETNSGGQLHSEYLSIQFNDDVEKVTTLAIEVEGPEAVLSKADFMMPTISGDRKVTKKDNKFYLATSDGNAIESMVFVTNDNMPSGTNNPPPKKEDDAPRQDGVVAWMKGFGVGTYSGGAALVTGTFDLVASVVSIPYKANELAVNLIWSNFNSEARDRADAQVAAATETAKSIADTTAVVGKLALKVKGDELAIYKAIFTQDYAELDRIFGEYSVYMDIGSEFFLEIADQMVAMDDYHKGETSGRIFFEVAMVIVPMLKVTQAANVAKAAGTVERANAMKTIATNIKNSKWLKNASLDVQGAVGRAVAKVEAFATKLTTTKMCFVAGTPIKTAQGWNAIEEIRAGDSVWSKNPDTGEIACRPVLNTFVTHPTKLHHITYRSGNSRRAHCVGSAVVVSASGEADAKPPGSIGELVCTAEHPFYVVDQKEFVEAGKLQTGNRLLLADGTMATVEGNIVEVAKEGQTFTTYNFEVAEFHTYFAGLEGVWVHNKGNECARIFSLYQRIMTKEQLGPIEAMAKVRAKLPGATKNSMSTAWGAAYKDLGGGHVPRGIRFLEDSPNPVEGTWESVFSGLRYGPDHVLSKFDNRIQHVLNHVKDIPTRAGAHGVFNVPENQIVDLLDEVWIKARNGGSKVVRTPQGTDRVLYLVDMECDMGYVGGVDGAIAGHPVTQKVLLIVDNERMVDGRLVADVVTAYPKKVP